MGSFSYISHRLLLAAAGHEDVSVSRSVANGGRTAQAPLAACAVEVLAPAKGAKAHAPRAHAAHRHSSGHKW